LHLFREPLFLDSVLFVMLNDFGKNIGKIHFERWELDDK
jgi:hypothetical protein